MARSRRELRRHLDQPPTIHLTIDRLILEDFAAVDAAEFADALSDEVATRSIALGIPSRLAASADIDRLTGPAIRVPARAGRDAGRNAGAAVYESLGLARDLIRTGTSDA